MIEVVPAGAGDAVAADDFVRRHPDALFYHSRGYPQLLADLLGARDVSLAAVTGGEVTGVLPLLAQDGPHGTVLNSLPYYGSNGGVLATDRSAAEALAHAYNELATAAGTLSATLVPSPFADSGVDVVHNLTDERTVQFTRIGGLDEEGLLELVDSSARRNVKKARRTGYAVTRDAQATDRLWQLHDANIRAIGGRPKSRRFFELVRERFTAGDDYDLWVATLDGDVAAALLVFYWQRTAEYFTPAVDVDHRSGQPLAGILAEAMTEAARRGMEVWNWGGTWLSQESLFRFKRKWGAEARPYTYRTQLNDERVLSLPRAGILAAYPDFYVAPFSALKKEEAPSPAS